MIISRQMNQREKSGPLFILHAGRMCKCKVAGCSLHFQVDSYRYQAIQLTVVVVVCIVVNTGEHKILFINKQLTTNTTGWPIGCQYVINITPNIIDRRQSTN